MKDEASGMTVNPADYLGKRILYASPEPNSPPREGEFRSVSPNCRFGLIGTEWNNLNTVHVLDVFPVGEEKKKAK